MPRPDVGLKAAVAKLAPLCPQGRPLSDPLAILVWENVGYLIDDGKRDASFAEFKRASGLTRARSPMRRWRC